MAKVIRPYLEGHRVTKTKPTNVAASVRARLLNLAKERGEDFNYVLTRYALERLLVRLVTARPTATSSCSKARCSFRAWSPRLHRPTKDLDLLGSGVPDLDLLARIFRDVSRDATVHDEGVVFDPDDRLWHRDQRGGRLRRRAGQRSQSHW